MTPKEKAKELFDKMYKADIVNSNYPMCFDSAKQCALIAVDEILPINSNPQAIKYWNEVKQKIELL